MGDRGCEKVGMGERGSEGTPRGNTPAARTTLSGGSRSTGVSDRVLGAFGDGRCVKKMYRAPFRYPLSNFCENTGFLRPGIVKTYLGGGEVRLGTDAASKIRLGTWRNAKKSVPRPLSLTPVQNLRQMQGGFLQPGLMETLSLWGRGTFGLRLGTWLVCANQGKPTSALCDDGSGVSRAVSL